MLVIQTARIISPGFFELYVSLSAIKVAGISCTDAVLITANIHISSDATSLSGVHLSSSFIAFMPSGVAAFPIPKRFATMFITMALRAAEFFLSRGKSIFVIG